MPDASAERDLVHDSRGTILVIGIVAGALLVGALWHVASIGDAIAWRERAQDAADAGAFENAVWHARGMNVIAAINIVMSLVLAVLVIWRTLLIICTLATVLAGVLCVFTAGAGCGVADVAADFEAFFLRNDNNVAKNVVRVLSAMSAAEVAVASATPIIAVVQGSNNTEAAYDITSAATESASLLPTLNPKTIETLAQCLKGDHTGKHRQEGEPHVGKHRQQDEPHVGKHHKNDKFDVGEAYQNFIANPRLGIGVSLPVQAESYSALCEKASDSALDSLAGGLTRMHAPSGLISVVETTKSIMGKVTGNLPGLFCSPMGEGAKPEGLTDVVGNRAIDSCKSQLKDHRVQGATHGDEDPMYRDEDGKVVNEKDYVKGCSKQKMKQANDKLKDSFETRETYDMTECGQPAKVWEWAVNGNFFMRSFAQVEKESPMTERDDRGLEVADRDQTGNVQPVVTDQVVAHAEMYFDCEGAWMDCRSDAPWQMRWRARLRRVQPLEKLLATAIEPGIVATLSHLVEGVGGLSEKIPAKFRKFKIIVPKLDDTWIWDKLTRDFVQKGLYRSGAFESAGEYVIKHAGGSPTIH